MSEHYYSENPTVKSDERKWEYTLRGRLFRFYSDRGVFSKSEVDFGSKTLIEAFTFPNVKGDLLDVGCGYGPIGLSLAKAEESRMVHMVDINERALQLSHKNAVHNDIHNVTIYESNRLEKVTKKDFGAILTNPPIRAGKEVVHAIFTEAKDHLVEGGELWVVIQKKQGAPSAIKKLQELFTSVETVVKKKGYYIIKAIKN